MDGDLRVPRKAAYTTGEVARAAGVSQGTVIREFDRGNLKGFHVPGSKFRRIPRAHLLAWMLRNNMPVTRLYPLDADEAQTVADWLAGNSGTEAQ